MKELILKNFPDLNHHELLKGIEAYGKLKTIESGEVMMEVGRYVKSIPLVTKGRLKVFREDDEGRELFLYYINPGETCAISLVCSERNRQSKIKAVAIEDSEFIAVPIRFMDEWMQQYKPWYYFVMETYRSRFEEVLNTVDSIAFHKLDERLLEYINKHLEVEGGDILHTTHQDIANELSTSREVISRLLKQLEKKGVVKLSRNQIELLK
jgi:CRP/FNR family transcriptional regulator, anaerobic regulatory protein